MKTIVSVQALRAIAALSVLLCHFNHVWLILNGKPIYPSALYFLASGVDLFFVISGFIMVYTSEHLFAVPGGPSHFLIKRIARIVPLYWAMTAIPILTFAWGWDFTLGSLFFIPYFSHGERIVPLHEVGWTLNYEMFFYVLFAAALTLPQRIAVPLLALFLVVVGIIGQLASLPIAPLRFWFDPIVIEFVFGMALAHLYRRKVILPFIIRMCLIVAAVAAIYLNADSIPGSGFRSGSRVLVWGIPAAMIFAAVTLGPRKNYNGPVARCLRLLGDASYSMYLVHPWVMILIYRKLWPYGLNKLDPTLVTICGFTFAVAISIVTYRAFERPTTIFLQSVLSRRQEYDPQPQRARS